VAVALSGVSSIMGAIKLLLNHDPAPLRAPGMTLFRICRFFCWTALSAQIHSIDRPAAALNRWRP